MSNHTITAEVEARFIVTGTDEFETAYPKIEITYSFSKGYPGCMYQSNGDPGDPPEPDEVQVVSAKVIDGDGLVLTDEQVSDYAEDWLQGDGYEAACEHAEYRDPDYARDLAIENREMFRDLGDDQ